MDTTWWADKTVQQDRAAFMAAVAVQQVRWDAEAKRIGQIISGIGLGDWAITAPRRGHRGYSLVVG